MIIPNSIPNFRLIDLIRAFFLSQKKSLYILKSYYSNITGKKYIIITNSCRTSLYLSYKALNIIGEVITTPLTCKVAIDPIIESGNMPIFVDVKSEDLTIDPNHILKNISSQTIAIQAIHLGGVACDMDKILNIAKMHKLIVIEDCAQSLGSTYKNKYTGSFGDISCFSLIKNAYGIGGGILATNDEQTYKEALRLNNQLKKTSKTKLLYRIVRSIIENKRKYKIASFLFNRLIKFKERRNHIKSISEQIRKITNIETKIAAYQTLRFDHLHNKRKLVGEFYYNNLNTQGILLNNNYNIANSSFTKFYIYNPKIQSKKIIEYLRNKGVEAMHLEQRQGSPLQPKIVEECEKELPNYHRIHDSIISLPIWENMNKKEINTVIYELNEGMK